MMNSNTHSSNAPLHMNVILLENDKVFLYTTVCQKPDEQLFMECNVLYDFVKKNRPLRTMGNIAIKDTLEINYNVKIYMHKLGIENVRGGSYTDEILPEYMVKTLTDEFALTRLKLWNSDEMLQDIFEKYGTLADDSRGCNVAAREVADPEYVSSGESVKDSILLTELNQYRETKELVNKLNIDRSLIADVEWLHTQIVCSQHSIETLLENNNVLNMECNVVLRKVADPEYVSSGESVKYSEITQDLSWITNWIECSQTPTISSPEFITAGSSPTMLLRNISGSLQTIEKNNRIISAITMGKKEKVAKYNNIMIQLKRIYSLFCLLNENDYGPIYEPIIHLTRPDIVFDTFIYHTKNLLNINFRDNAIEEAEKLMKHFEYMIHTIINRVDEHSFYLSTFPEDYELRTMYAINMIKHYDTTNQPLKMMRD